jgi:catechol 2,3-dioxygenase-like lactoylglutathione lyase family enzyme
MKRMTRRATLLITMLAAVVLTAARLPAFGPFGLFAQGAAPANQPVTAGAVNGIGPYLHLVADLDRSVDFYQALLGSTPSGTAETRAWGRNEPVAVMYGAPGAEIRTATVPVPGSEMAVELVAFRGIARRQVEPRISDAGAALLLLFVRDIDAAMTAVTAHGGSILTPDGRPVVVREPNRFIIVRDPDGFFIELLQTAPLPAGAAAGNVVTGRFRTTAMNAEQTVRFYRDALGFPLPDVRPFGADPVLRGMTGLASATTRLAIGVIPGTSVGFEVLEFNQVERTRTRADIHGIGASMLRLRVSDIDTVFSKMKSAGGTPVTAQPVTLKDNRRMVIVEDLDGLFVQLWQVAPSQ